MIASVLVNGRLARFDSLSSDRISVVMRSSINCQEQS